MATFSLLSLTYANPSLLGPLHLIALLDPTADWLKKWMVSSFIRDYSLRVLYQSLPQSACLVPLQHGQYGRSYVLEALEKYPIIVSTYMYTVQQENLVRFILIWQFSEFCRKSPNLNRQTLRYIASCVCDWYRSSTNLEFTDMFRRQIPQILILTNFSPPSLFDSLLCSFLFPPFPFSPPSTNIVS